MHPTITILLWINTIGCGLIAGVYFTFSTFVMQALGQLPGSLGMTAMVSINRVILRSAFMPLFLITTLASLGLLIFALLQLSQPGNWAAALGSGIYLIGMFLCTMVLNVPLNNKLEEQIHGSAAADQVWSHYLKQWTRWNHVRTLASTVAFALFVLALCARG